MELIHIIFVISTVTGMAWGQTCAPGECSESSLPKPMGTGLSGYTPGGNGCYSDGTTVTYICTGSLIGPPSTQCDGGVWIPPVGPTCEAASGCTRPQLPSNGNVTEYKDEYALYERITYSCDDGYSIIGPQEAVCDSGGIWDPSNIPTCAASCTAPSIQNGGPNGTFVNGEVVTYSCDVNYTLIGVSTATCRDGLWDPDNIPECLEKCLPPIVANSNFDTQQDVIDHGSSVVIDCDPGYSTGSSTSTTVNCNEGSLSNPSPACYENCSPLDAFMNGQVTGDTSPFYHTETVSFVCDPGFTLDGPSSISCFDGNWDAPQPMCMGDCPDIVPKPNSAFFGAVSPFHHGETVTFTCYNGYDVYNGSLVSTCQDGQWSSEPPFCAERITTTQAASTMGNSVTTGIPSTSMTTVQETTPGTTPTSNILTSSKASSTDVLPTSLVTITDIVTEIKTTLLGISTNKSPSSSIPEVTTITAMKTTTVVTQNMMSSAVMTSEMTSSEITTSEKTSPTDAVGVTSRSTPGSASTAHSDVSTQSRLTSSPAQGSTTAQAIVTSEKIGSMTSAGDDMTASPGMNVSISTTAGSSKGMTEDQKVVVIVSATALGVCTLLAIVIALINCHHTRQGTSDKNVYETNGPKTNKSQHAYDNNGIVLVNTHL
ncbi:sushi, von Willebrand factor type A, EGF and pentraxin domain-containing protein 1-like [Lytechinus pictus]|uniref:sushi, von Willebrand factor type A, EGF and pentraxin domain-containing protein 1-like n=1 Tax=Lytechinus pictus TaxID=7653 RepID=UPI0030BA1670